MFTADSWRSVVDKIGGIPGLIGQDPNGPDGQLTAEGMRYLTRLVNAGTELAIEYADPDYPQFMQVLSTTLQWGLPAADCFYTLAAVKGGETYRIFGNRGTARVFDVEMWSGDLCRLSSFTLESKCKEYEVAEDGTIEVILSSDERPGNWLKLPDGPGTVVVRQYFYDWDNEEAGLLYIEREGARYPPPPLDPAVMRARLETLGEFFVEAPELCRRTVESYLAVPDSTVEFAPISFGWQDLLFGKGHYNCASDQAVILETPAPDCWYWNYQLSNHNWEALDWHLRSTSINGHQAVIDSDGMFRAVISHSDPGVPNWLDTAGREIGLIAARYYRPGEITPPTLRVVPIDEVRSNLPPDTPTVSPDERQATLRRRMLAARRTMRD